MILYDTCSDTKLESKVYWITALNVAKIYLECKEIARWSSPAQKQFLSIMSLLW